MSGSPIAFPLHREGTMHIHGNSMSINAADFYSAGEYEKAAAAKRAADLRKKLLKGAAAIESAATPEESLLISQWLDSRHSQVQSQDEYHTTDEGKDSDFG
jgi:hypothetical protein